MYLALNNTDVSDLTKGLKVSFETLVSDNSGRNAHGDSVIDVINKKIKIQAVFRPMLESDMQRLLGAIEGYVIPVTFKNPKDGAQKTITCYTGSPEPEYYTISGKVLYKEMSLNFIEL